MSEEDGEFSSVPLPYVGSVGGWEALTDGLDHRAQLLGGTEVVE